MCCWRGYMFSSCGQPNIKIRASLKKGEKKNKGTNSVKEAKHNFAIEGFPGSCMMYG